MVSAIASDLLAMRKQVKELTVTLDAMRLHNSKKMDNVKEVMNIDATPNEDYPLRILKTYRDLCDTRCSSITDFFNDMKEDNPIIVMMNKNQEQRAKILDKAINILSQR